MLRYVFEEGKYPMEDAFSSVVTTHKDILERYASQGYRYVGMIPTEQNLHGCIRKMDLIFEKEAA